ncbi:MAG: polyphosphate kinase, partial [Butyrivibrio sp.]|nr:polyphosphate kinase [Butyrivibrio sp.]
VSDNIEVRSIVGTFLEHSRIFCFGNNGQEEIYMGSCDWMPRNLDRRVEILFPVENKALKARVRHILEVQLSDNVKSRFLGRDGSYEKHPRAASPKVASQKVFCAEADALVKNDAAEENTRVFVPLEK